MVAGVSFQPNSDFSKVSTMVKFFWSLHFRKLLGIVLFGWVFSFLVLFGDFLLASLYKICFPIFTRVPLLSPCRKNGRGPSQFLDLQVWLFQLIWIGAINPKKHKLVFRASSQTALVPQIITRNIAPVSHYLPWFVIWCKTEAQGKLRPELWWLLSCGQWTKEDMWGHSKGFTADVENLMEEWKLCHFHLKLCWEIPKSWQ